jgi:hypothetical protein
MLESLAELHVWNNTTIMSQVRTTTGFSLRAVSFSAQGLVPMSAPAFSRAASLCYWPVQQRDYCSGSIVAGGASVRGAESRTGFTLGEEVFDMHHIA